MECPKCGTETEDTANTCKHCGAELNNFGVERLAALFPPDPPALGKAAGYSRGIFENITAGTYLWKKVGWKGVIIFLLCLILIVLLIFVISSVFQ